MTTDNKAIGVMTDSIGNLNEITFDKNSNEFIVNLDDTGLRFEIVGASNNCIPINKEILEGKLNKIKQDLLKEEKSISGIISTEEGFIGINDEESMTSYLLDGSNIIKEYTTNWFDNDIEDEYDDDNEDEYDDNDSEDDNNEE